MEKLKSFLANDALYLAMLITSVGALSFLLGRQSVSYKNFESCSVNALTLCAPKLCPTFLPDFDSSQVAKTPSLEAASPYHNAHPNLPFVASKSGTRYHHITCPGAKRIKEENKIFFRTSLEAQAAGYSRAVNCDYD